jgi:protein Tex
VHVSQLADRFVKDPAEVVRVGQKVQVTVVSVDLERNRIALSMKKQLPSSSAPAAREGKKPPTVTPSKGTVAPNGMRFS